MVLPGPGFRWKHCFSSSWSCNRWNWANGRGSHCGNDCHLHVSWRETSGCVYWLSKISSWFQVSQKPAKTKCKWTTVVTSNSLMKSPGFWWKSLISKWVIFFPLGYCRYTNHWSSPLIPNFHPGTSKLPSFRFAFGISWGFGAWLYISEIMPLRVRGKAVGLCTAVTWRLFSAQTPRFRRNFFEQKVRTSWNFFGGARKRVVCWIFFRDIILLYSQWNVGIMKHKPWNFRIPSLNQKGLNRK